MPTHSSNSRSRIAVLITTFAALLCITPWLTGPAQAAQQPGGAVAAPKTAATDVGQRLERFEDRDTTREKDWAGSADETMEACARFNAVAQNVTTQVKLVEDAGGPLDYAKTGVVPQRLGGLGIAACGEVVAVADFCSDAVVGSPVPVAVIDNWRDAIAAKG